MKNDSIHYSCGEYTIGDSSKILEQYRLKTILKKDNDTIVDILNKTTPTDRFCFSEKELEYLKGTVFYKNFSGASSDLFFAHQIPVTDCEINVLLDNGHESKYRVYISDDYIDSINTLHDDMISLLGFMLIPIEGTSGCVVCPICIKNGDTSILTSTCIGYYNLREREFRDFVENIPIDVFSKAFSSNINLWYLSQILLLHPQIKEVFQNPEIVRNYNNTIRKMPSRKKKKLCYIKKHVISERTVEKTLNSKSHNMRHTLVWHVIGHWRTYKNGKKVFIQPYWKGVLRDTKKIETRERVFPEPKS